jgi:hypothetical protein
VISAKSGEDIGEFIIRHQPRDLDQNSPVIEKQFAPVGWGSRHVLQLALIATKWEMEKEPCSLGLAGGQRAACRRIFETGSGLAFSKPLFPRSMAEWL